MLDRIGPVYNVYAAPRQCGFHIHTELGCGQRSCRSFSSLVLLHSTEQRPASSFWWILYQTKILKKNSNTHIFSLITLALLLLSGVAIGAGWQSVVAYVNVTCYYVIGIPTGVCLGYLIGYQVKVWVSFRSSARFSNLAC